MVDESKNWHEGRLPAAVGELQKERRGGRDWGIVCLVLVYLVQCQLQGKSRIG